MFSMGSVGSFVLMAAMWPPSGHAYFPEHTFEDPKINLIRGKIVL